MRMTTARIHGANNCFWAATFDAADVRDARPLVEKRPIGLGMSGMHEPSMVVRTPVTVAAFYLAKGSTACRSMAFEYENMRVRSKDASAIVILPQRRKSARSEDARERDANSSATCSLQGGGHLSRAVNLRDSPLLLRRPWQRTTPSLIAFGAELFSGLGRATVQLF